jgi:hypothetical protein
MKKNSEDSSNEVKVLKRRRSTGYFYLLFADLAIVACLVASVVVSSASFPWHLGSCSDSEYKESRMIRGVRIAAGDPNMNVACRRGVMIQIMSMVSA